MVKIVSIKKFGRVNTGGVDYDRIDKSLNDMVDAINTNAKELIALSDKQTYTIIQAYDNPGLHSILQGNKHGSAKIINAWVQVGDNIDVTDIVKIIGITNTINIEEAEKSGKVRIFTIKKPMLNFYENVVMQKQSNRRVLVGLTLEIISQE